MKDICLYILGGVLQFKVERSVEAKKTSLWMPFIFYNLHGEAEEKHVAESRFPELCYCVQVT